jgi:hypothetical protein
MNNSIIVVAYKRLKDLKGSDVIALGADTVIVKEKGAMISVNPANGSEFIPFTYNDEIRILPTTVLSFKQPTSIALVSTGSLAAYHDASFNVKSNTTIVCPDIATSTAVASDFIEIRESRGFEIDSINATVKNISGRTLTMYGSLELSIEQTGGQPSTLHIASQKSTDGVNWEFIQDSYRAIYIAKDGVDIINLDSVNEFDWTHGMYTRWVFAKSGSGGVSIKQPSIAWSAETVLGRAIVWKMRERIRV